MTGSPTWQWSLKSMFGLMSACGVMAFWLRLRLAIDPEWTWGRSISLSEGLALGCLSVWLVQCLSSRPLVKTSLRNTPRCELPAAAILLSALDTVRNITAGYMSLCCHLSAERLKRTVEEIANNNAILGYGFVVSCTLGMFIVLPRARESLRLWFPLRAAVVSVNIGLVVGFCNWWAGRWLWAGDGKSNPFHSQKKPMTADLTRRSDVYTNVSISGGAAPGAREGTLFSNLVVREENVTLRRLAIV